jgi:hypothetical protein
VARSLTGSTIAGIVLAAVLAACSGLDSGGTAYVRIFNDFNDPSVSANTFQPPWTICESSYRGTEFGRIGLEETSYELAVTPGDDYVLMVAAWNDPTCKIANCLPIAGTSLEETVDGQHRTITMQYNNHAGPCPPTGIAPIPEAQYDRILALWPTYKFLPYAERTQNPECLAPQ